MKFGKILALCCLSLLVKSHAMGGRSRTENTLLSSDLSCNSRLALKTFKKKFAKTYVPKGDGTAPWPRLYGAWVNTDRGVVAVIKGEEAIVEGRSRDIVRVRIYHLCDSKLMAEGARYIEKIDYKTEILSIRLKMIDNTVPYPYFDAFFTVVKDRVGEAAYVDTQMISPVVDNRRLNDRFKLRQP